jgi:hypothetical protein
MSDEQRKPQWLERCRAKRQPKRHRTAMDKLFAGVDGDSEEKAVQRHTSQGEELEAEDRARIIKGGAGRLGRCLEQESGDAVAEVPRRVVGARSLVSPPSPDALKRACSRAVLSAENDVAPRIKHACGGLVVGEVDDGD